MRQEWYPQFLFSVSMKDTVNPKDIIQDVVHNFSSRYRGYAQYHNIQVNIIFGYVFK